MTRPRTLAAALGVLAALALPAAASAAPLPADTTAVISGTPDLLGLLPSPVSTSFAGTQAVSRDGRFVAFSSESDGLISGDDDDVSNVYVQDTTTGAITLVSRATGVAGEPSHSNCELPAISDDGRRVAFACEGPLDPSDTNGRQDVYLRDLVTGETVLVSRAPGLGAVGNGESDEPSLDAMGVHVAFRTHSDNLGDGVTPGAAVDTIYVRTIGGTNGETLVSRADKADGAPAGDDSRDPSISNDGNRVAFETVAALDATADTNGRSDIYLRDIAGKTTSLVSRATGLTGAVGNGPSRGGLISGDGNFVAFTSNATNLDNAHDSTNDSDAYRRVIAGSSTALMSQTNAGVKANAEAFATGIDDDGLRVAFITAATNLDPADTVAGRNNSDVYVNTQQGMMLASRRDGVSGAPLNDANEAALSGDGSTVSFELSGSASADVEPDATSVALRRLNTGSTTTVSRPAGGAPFLNQGGEAFGSSVSADGRYVAFTSSASGLGVPGSVGRAIFVRDTVTGAVALVSRQDGPNGAPIGPLPFDPQISADGRRVVFEVTAPEGDGQPDPIFLRDIVAGRTYRIDSADGPNGAPGNAGGFDPSISDDGSRVAFLSTSTNLGDGDTDNLTDVHVRDITTGRTILASRADGASGAKENDGAGQEPVISGNGKRVVFQTRATNLGDGDTDAALDIHVRDIDAGRTILASSATGVTKQNLDSERPSISRDGNKVSFLSEVPFVADPPGEKLYLRDLAAGTVVLAGRADGPNGAAVTAGGFNAETLSDDGNVVAFNADPANSIAPGAPANGINQVYVRNLSAGTTRLASRRTGANGDPVGGQSGVELGSLTADGGCVTFGVRGRLLPPPASADFEQIYMRVLAADCGGRDKGTSVLQLARDKVAPKLSKAHLSHRRFRVGSKTTALSARVARGTVLSVRLSEAAKLTVTVDRRLPRRHHSHKVRYKRDGTVVRSLKAGSARISFSGRLGHRRLAIGVHRLTLVARDAAGNVSKRVTLRFTVVR
jgi:Tol biopolymer transport system component